MKKISVSIVLLVAFVLNSLGQDATVIYKNTVGSTVTIETELGIGSGFFVAPNVIASNYHVIEGAVTANCFLSNSQTRYEIDGYVGVDQKADLVLLHVVGLDKPKITMASGSPTPGEKVFVMGSPKGLPATISDGIVSGLRDFDGIKHIQMTAPISPGSSGGPVMNGKGELIGVSVSQYTEGQNINFAVPRSYLQLLLDFMNSEPQPLMNLLALGGEYIDLTTDETYSGEDATYEINMFPGNKPQLVLDYMASWEEQTCFYFTYTVAEDYASRYTSIYMKEYTLIDRVSGKKYYANYTDLPTDENDPRWIYRGSESPFLVCFDRIPSSVTSFDLIEGTCEDGQFCITELDVASFKRVTNDEVDWDLYEEADTEGTVSFYSHYGGSGDVSFYIEGIYVGKLDQYFEDQNYSPSCGDDGTLVVRLPAGTYNYKASDSKYNWSGTVTIEANGCLSQGIRE